MKFCSNCGKEINENASICLNCGYYLKQPALISEDDAPSSGFAILGFFFPLVGLILYLVWNSTFPLKAKSAGKGALIGVITAVCLYIFMIIVLVTVSIASSADYYMY